MSRVQPLLFGLALVAGFVLFAGPAMSLEQDTGTDTGVADTDDGGTTDVSEDADSSVEDDVGESDVAPDDGDDVAVDDASEGDGGTVEDASVADGDDGESNGTNGDRSDPDDTESGCNTTSQPPNPMLILLAGLLFFIRPRTRRNER